MKPDFTTRPRIRQSGYALLLMVLALMGLGGVVIAGFTQGVKQESEQERYLHNQRVLQEAKLALLQYAYNYPQMGPGQNDGPGRLPCADTDNDGMDNYSATCAANRLGRFPWRETSMNFYDARDASGERLWYAVSSNFGRGAGSKVNSDRAGTITVRDRSGAILYDGTDSDGPNDDNLHYGVAAIIIAPGAPIARGGTVQDRSVSNDDKSFDFVADDDPGIIDAEKYLDLLGAVDNAEFVNSDPNGFVTGPIRDVVTGDLLVNDQMIIVTAAEVQAMAEMATLQAYRTAINDYLDKTGGVYPWLYNYEGIEYNPAAPANETVDVAIDKLSSFFPVGGCDDSLTYLPDPPSWHNEDDCVANGGTWDTGFAAEMEDYIGRDVAGGIDGVFGRIPSIFAEYFTETDSQQIDTRLSGSMTLIDPSGADTFTLSAPEPGDCDKSCDTGGPRTFVHDPDPDVEGPVIDIDIPQILTGVRFVDIDPDTTGNDVRIRATFPAPESVPFDLYFWGEHDKQDTIWTACPGGADELSDCVFSSGSDRSILHLHGNIDFSGIEDFDFDNDPPPTITWSPASGTGHAWIAATYPADKIISFPGVFSSVTYEYDGHWHKDDTVIKDGDHSDEDYSTGTVDMTGFTLGSLTLGMRYYPEIPAWAFDNDWHNSIRMAYAIEYAPPGTGPCNVGTTCLKLDDSPGAPQNVASLLVIAGRHDWKDLGSTKKLRNSLLSVFDNGNENTNPTFYRHRDNDKLLVIEEL
jgi:type II secretory pathway pseudopilin PulG